jgi:hypothetical protein
MQSGTCMSWDLFDYVSRLHFLTLHETLEPRCSSGLASSSSDAKISTISVSGCLNFTRPALAEKS